MLHKLQLWPVCLLLPLLFSCQSDEPADEYLEGHLSFPDESAAGIKLAIYEFPDLPLQLDTLETAFSLNGKENSVRKMYALLTGDPIATTSSDADGHFNFDLPPETSGLLLIYDHIFVFKLLVLTDYTSPLELELIPGIPLTSILETVPILAPGTPILLEGTVIVPVDRELVIPEGCLITSLSGFSLGVWGGLSMNGTADQPLFMFPHPETTNNNGNWQIVPTESIYLNHLLYGGWSEGLFFQNSDAQLSDCCFLEIENSACSFTGCIDTVRIEDCLFRSSQTAISLVNSDVAVSGSIIASSYYGVEFTSAGGRVEGNLLLDNDEAIACIGGVPSAPLVVANLFSSNRSDIALKQNDTPTITNNESRGVQLTFLHNRNNGLPLLQNNNIIAPESLLVFHSLPTNVVGRINAAGNFWGYSDSLQIEAHIVDSLDNPELLRVDISGFFPVPLELGFQ